MKILFITSYLPYPPDHGGKIRIYHLLSRLAARHEVTVATLLEPDDDHAKIEALQALGIRVVAARKPIVRQGLAKVRRLLDPRPRLITEHLSPDLNQLISDVVRNDPPDIIHCEQVYVVPYAAPYKHIPRVLDEHVIEHILIRQIAAARPGALSRLAGSLDALKLRYFEVRSWKSLDSYVVTSALDQKVIQAKNPSGQVHVVPNGVDLSYFKPTWHMPVSEIMIMTGTVGYYPNLEGIEWFLRDIFPLVMHDTPGASLRLVGQLNSAAAETLGRPANVTMTGRVADVRPYVGASRVFVVPLRIGGGTRLKILEAFAQGIPVVSTTTGAEGIDCVNGEHLLIADTPTEFASAVNLLMHDDELAKKLSANGRRLVEERYNWDSCVQRLERIYADLAYGTAANTEATELNFEF